MDNRDSKDQHIGLLMYRVEQLEERADKYETLLEKITDTQQLLSQKVIALETQERINSDQVAMLMASNKLQTKLLVGIVSSSVVTLLTLVLKAIAKV